MGSGIARHARAQVRAWRGGCGLGMEDARPNGKGRARGGWAGMGWAGTCGSHREVIGHQIHGPVAGSLEAPAMCIRDGN